ncbi:Sodium Bile acid symporter family protein [Planctomycetes bacterium MalM25]|nr:Sodium Bile acid symporter family protein [Planctomycetes bacterium MalM25]
MIAAVGRQWFLLALAGVLVVGSAAHATLAAFTASIPKDALVFAIMLAMSAPLDLKRSLNSRTAALAVAIGVGVNAGLAGPLAWLAGRGLPSELALGLVIAALSPCTLASAAVWTRRGGGVEAVALGVTVVTNLLSFLVLPAWAWTLLGQGAEIDAVALGTRLLLIVVAPIALGQMLRKASGFRAWSDRHRKRLSLAAQLGLLGMVLIGAVRTGAVLTDPATRLGPTVWGGLIVAAAAVHTALFAIAWSASRGAGVPRPEALASAVAGSQKTLAVGLSVAMEYGSLAILPMIVYHALQLLIDTVLVDRLRVPPESSPRQTSETGDGEA